MTNHPPEDRPSGRTTVITAASITAVLLASLFAIGANLGILTSADKSPLGTVTAAGDLTSDTLVIDGSFDERTDDPTSAALPGAQRFTVDEAGTVDVAVGPEGARLDLASPSSGWTATPVTIPGADVALVFTNGTRTLEFTAVVGPDGTVTGDVTEPSLAATTPRPTSVHDSDDDESHDDHESDEDHDYEGSDDDD